MAFTTKSSDSLLSQGQVVQNDPTRSDFVAPHAGGVPVGLVIDASEVYGGDLDNPTVTGYSARIIYGGGDHPVQVETPTGYDGRISRFDVQANGVITPVEVGGVGSLVGLNPTWATWG